MRRIGDMAQVERSQQYQAALSNINTEWSKARQSVVQLSSQLQVNVMPDLKAFDTSLSQQKATAAARKKQFEQLQSTSKKLNELQIKTGGPEAAEMQRRHATELEAMAQTEGSFNTSMMEFEYARLELVRQKMNYILRSYVAYHAQCLETLSRGLANFNAVDSISESQQLWIALSQYDQQNSIVANPDAARNVNALSASPSFNAASAVGAGLMRPGSPSFNSQVGANPGVYGASAYNGGINMHMQPPQQVFSPSGGLTPSPSAVSAGAYAQPQQVGLGASQQQYPQLQQQPSLQYQPSLQPQSFSAAPSMYQPGVGVPASPAYGRY
jgi:hypothetical protein